VVTLYGIDPARAEAFVVRWRESVPGAKVARSYYI
jgi:hypothetical protein